MKVQIKKLHPEARMPTYATDGSGCFDFYAVERGYIHPNYHHVFNLGIAIQIPEDHVLLIFSRSGQGFAHDVRLSNCVGVVDSDYRGEIKVKLASDSNIHGYVVDPGDRIAQGLIIKFDKVTFELVDELDNTARGEGGFGSTN